MRWVEALVVSLEVADLRAVVHRWTLNEIMAYNPRFGASSGGGWFYGVVKTKSDGLVLAEVYPQMGYAPIEEKLTRNQRTMKMIVSDVLSIKPKWIGKAAVQRAAKIRARNQTEHRRNLAHTKATANCKHFPHWMDWDILGSKEWGRCAHCWRMLSHREWENERRRNTGKDST